VVEEREIFGMYRRRRKERCIYRRKRNERWFWDIQEEEEEERDIDV